MSGLGCWALWALLVCSLAQVPGRQEDLDLGWNEWKTYYNRTYAEEHLTERHGIWQTTREYVLRHNAEAQLGTWTYTQTLNKFADFSPDEMAFYIARLGYRPPDSGTRRRREVQDLLESNTLPSYINWVEQGAVTAVRDQGLCGSCYAFSAMGALEGAHFLKTGTDLTQLSEQNIVDCSFDNGNDGCDGGNMENSFAYIYLNDGVNTESAYPYISGMSGHAHQCQFNPNGVGSTCAGYLSLFPRDEVNLQVAVAEYGPVSCAMTVTDNFLLYSAGVYSSNNCSSSYRDMNHAVLIVGYGTADDGLDYWLVKNSWSATWGEQGYMRLLRGQNMCGIANDCTLPVIQQQL